MEQLQKRFDALLHTGTASKELMDNASQLVSKIKLEIKMESVNPIVVKKMSIPKMVTTRPTLSQAPLFLLIFDRVEYLRAVRAL